MGDVVFRAAPNRDSGWRHSFDRRLVGESWRRVALWLSQEDAIRILIGNATGTQANDTDSR